MRQSLTAISPKFQIIDAPIGALNNTLDEFDLRLNLGRFQEVGVFPSDA